MEKSAQLMFDYLGDVIYNPQNAALDVEALDPSCRELGRGLLYWGNALMEAARFARALSLGNLDAALPPAANELAAPLKSLHASLKHLTWQTQQVAKGDYNQRVDFLGEFSDAFNAMTAQLDQRQKALLAEIESSKAKTAALVQSNTIFEALAAGLPQMIVIMDVETRTPVYMNTAAEARLAEGLLSDGAETRWMTAHLQTLPDDSPACSFEIDRETFCFSVSAYPLDWYQRGAIAYIIRDISKERQRVRQLENAAFNDMLTGVYSRLYGMELLHSLLAAKQRLTVSFVDLDGLKYVNDTFGHSEGDQYIINVANGLSAFSGSVLCRLGGDEFMIIAPNFGYDETTAAIDSIRKTLLDQSPGAYKQSISYGVVAVQPEDDTPVSDILSLADERMYEFKRSHRQHRSK